MKKILVLTLLLMMTASCFAGATQYNLFSKGTPIPSDWFRTGRLNDFGTNWARDIDALVALGQNPGTGKVFYVDSGVANEGDGSSWLNAKDTLDEAVALCTADRGDFIYVAPNHKETWAQSTGDDADLDVSGITVIGIGDGNMTPTFTYTDVNNELVFGAKNVTIVNLRLLAGVSEIVAAISVEAAGDYATIAYCTFPLPTTNSFEFLDTIDVVSGATYIRVLGNNAQNDDAGAAPAHFIDLGNALLVGIHIEDNVIFGDFSVSAIWSDDADTEVYIYNNTITNQTADQHCIEFTGAATGVCAGNLMFSSAEATTLDPGSLALYENYTVTATDKSGQIAFQPDNGINMLNATTITAIESDVSEGLTGQASAGRNSLLGTQVSRAAAEIFDGTTTSLFTIATGRVMVTHLSMQNSVAAADSTANAVKVIMNPSTGTSTDLCATLDVANDEIITLYSISGTFATALIQSGAANSGAVISMTTPVILDVGTIDLSSAGDSGAGATDVQTSVELWYFPIDDGATVVTAP